MVEQVALKLKPLYSEKQIGLEIELSEPVLKVEADRERIHQVLINLLGNALQYTPPNGTVRIYTEAKPNMIVGGGSGIGLTIAHHIIKAWGGGRICSGLSDARKCM